MTAYVVIECDVWECANAHDHGAEDKPKARRWAKGDGWTSFVGKDYCPEHARNRRDAPAKPKRGSR